MEDLQGDRPVMPEIVREKHGGKTTAPELALDTILGRELIRECGEVTHT